MSKIRVKATEPGYYVHIYRKEGDVFWLNNSEQLFSEKWMERVDEESRENDREEREDDAPIHPAVKPKGGRKPQAKQVQESAQPLGDDVL